MSLANTYTKEHVENGRFMLQALRSIEEGNIDQAKLRLRGHVSTKVIIIDAVKIPPISQRDIELIEGFYREVIEYFNYQGGFNETMQVKENGFWVNKPTPAMQILEDFAAK